MRAMLAMMVALPSIAPASTLTIVHQSIPVDLKQRSKLIASTLDANANQTGFEIVHQSFPVIIKSCCYKKCNMTFKPVCDSYGDTHGNKCVFEIAACEAKKKKKELTIVEEGVCGGCSRYEYKRKRCITDFFKGHIHVAWAKPRFCLLYMQREDPLTEGHSPIKSGLNDQEYRVPVLPRRPHAQGILKILELIAKALVWT